MPTREEVQLTLERLLDGFVDDIVASFVNQPDSGLSVEDAIKWGLVAIGESVDIAAIEAKLRETEPDVEIDDAGLNREGGYIWVRLVGAEEARDEETGEIPPAFFRKLSALSLQPMSTVIEDVDTVEA